MRHDISRRTSLAALFLAALVSSAVVAIASPHGPALADEFIYLAGGRYLAETGSLDARYYDARAILHQGYPHQDNHSPGYVLVLGAMIKVLGGGYWTAVALNLAAIVLGALSVRTLALHLGRTDVEAFLAGLLFLTLPALLPYVSWVMAEVALVTLFLATLACAARLGRGAVGGLLIGLLFGATFLVRESALFGLPAVLSLLRGRRAVIGCLGASLAFGLFAYAPLSAHRSEGASNFWTPTYGKEFGFEVVRSARQGDLRAMARLGAARVSMNVREFLGPTTSATERGILGVFVMLPVCALSRWRGLTAPERRFLGALSLGWLGLCLVMAGVYVVARWAGFRYLMFLAAAFLPFAVGPARRERWRWGLPALVALLSLVVNGGVLSVLAAFKASRQRRQAGITEYVERYVDARLVRRIALPNGWLFGLKHYPTEVISSLPETGGELRVLEQQLWFDFLVLPGNSPLGPEWDGRLRYRRLNAAETDPPLLVYRRLK